MRTYLLLSFTFIQCVLYSQPGNLDPTFGDNGKIQLSLGNLEIENTCITTDSAGNIYLGGYEYDYYTGETYANIIKLEQDGDIDTTFSSQGIFKLKEHFPNFLYENSIYAITVQEDNKIVFGGNVNTEDGDYYFFGRIFHDGSIDSSFGNQGTLLFQIPSKRDEGVNYLLNFNSIHILPDGKIITPILGVYITGYWFDSDQVYILLCLSEDGKIDSSYGTSGYQELLYDELYRILQVPVFNDGYIYCYYSSFNAEIDNVSKVIKTSYEGIPDSTFGINGVYEIPHLTASYSDIYSIHIPLVLEDNSILYMESRFQDDFATIREYYLSKLMMNGELDESFGSQGVLKIPIEPGYEFRGFSIQMPESGGEIIIGGIINEVNDQQEFVSSKLRKYVVDHDGTSFSYTDKVFLPYPGKHGARFSLPARGLNNSVFLYGSAGCYPNCRLDYIVMKIAGDGNPDLAFGENGWREPQLNVFSSEIKKIYTTSDGDVYFAGYGNTSENREITLMGKLNSNGKPDGTFGNNGFSFQSQNGVMSRINDFVINNNIIYAVGGTDQSEEGNSKLLVSKFNLDGNIDSDFGEAGFLPFYNYAEYSVAHTITVLPDESLLVGGTREGIPTLFKVNTNGTLDDNFGVSGIIWADSEPSELHDLVIQSNEKIVSTAFSTNTEENRDFLLFRNMSNGATDHSFGESGKLAIDMGTTDDLSQAIERYQDDRLLVAGSVGKFVGLVRLSKDGEMDNTFGTAGKKYVSAGSITGFGDMILGPDERILLALTTESIANYQLALAMLKPNGDVDSTFGENGFVHISDTTRNLIAQSIAYTPEGDILLAGTAVNSADKLSSLIVKVMGSPSLGIIDDRMNAFDLTIYPVPVRDYLTLEFELQKQQFISVQLLDIQGRLVQNIFSNKYFNSGKNKLQTSIIENLHPGTYFLKMSVGNQIIKTTQLIKQ